MSKSVYTVEMIETMTAQAPLNAEKCAALATEFGNLVLQAVPLLQKQKARALTTTVKAKPARKKAAASKLDISQSNYKSGRCG